MRTLLPILFAGVIGTLCSCGSAEEGATGQVTTPVTPPKRSAFETTTDTVHTENAGVESKVSGAGNAPTVQFMVQIGAFRNPKNAHAVQDLVRERYHVPVINDYNARYRFYEIRIGFFATRGAAVEFLRKLQHEYPADYKDSWVVELQR